MPELRTFHRAIVVNVAVGILTGLTCSAQTAPVTKLEKGTALVAELTKDVNSKKAKPGATVKATVIQDVLAHGAIIVRRDSKLLGHITEVKASSKDDRESRLGIVFDRVILKGGGEVDLKGIIDAVAAPLPQVSRVDKPSEMLPPSMMGGSRSNGAPQPIGTPQTSASARQASTSSSTTSSRGIDTNSPMPLPSQTPANAAGGLSAGTHGVLGIKGVTLTNGNSSSTTGTILRSEKNDIKLEFGTQVVIQVTGDGKP
jgi:hypothetical protein